MTSTDWIHYIQDAYSTEPEHPWADKPEFSVFRHASNKKWFALFMTVKASLLGLPGAEEVPVLNLKADPRLIGPQREKPGFFPAYHMNKEHWITAALDGSAPEDALDASTRSSVSFFSRRLWRSSTAMYSRAVSG